MGLSDKKNAATFAHNQLILLLLIISSVNENRAFAMRAEKNKGKKARAHAGEETLANTCTNARKRRGPRRHPDSLRVG